MPKFNVELTIKVEAKDVYETTQLVQDALKADGYTREYAITMIEELDEH